MNVNQSTSSATFCLKLSIENLVPSLNSYHLDENAVLCLNLYLMKENLTDGYYLCENAFFPVTKLFDTGRPSTATGMSNPDLSSTSFAQKNHIEKCALFCDISEKVVFFKAFHFNFS